MSFNLNGVPGLRNLNFAHMFNSTAYGSTGNGVVWVGKEQYGDAIRTVSDAIMGDYFLIQEAGVYLVSALYLLGTASDSFWITKGESSTTGNVTAYVGPTLTNSTIVQLAQGKVASNDGTATAVAMAICVPGDRLRVRTNGVGLSSNGTTAHFYCTKIA